MRFLVAGILAAGFSWMGNRAALKLFGIQVIVALVPCIEELAKSGAAFLMGTSLILTHGVFGFIEGIYDAWGSGRRGIKAGLISVAGHGFYGYITTYILQRYALFWAAVAAASVVHVLWNLFVMKYVVKKRGTAG